MSRISDIISNARIELADTVTPYRWSDSNLLTLVDMGQKTISTVCNSLHRKISLTSASGKNSYILPTDVRLIQSVKVDGTVLRLIRLDEMEELDSRWEESIGSAVYAIYDNIDRGTLKLSPIPTTNVEIQVTYIAYPDDITSTTDNLALDSVYDICLGYYVIFRATAQSQDTQDMNVSSMYKDNYTEELNRLRREASSGFLSTQKPFVTTYNNGFNQ